MAATDLLLLEGIALASIVAVCCFWYAFLRQDH